MAKMEGMYADYEETDLNVKLIELVREYPFIYDAGEPRHANRALIDKSWATIAAEINLDIEDTRTRWTRLRNNFCKALARRQRSPRNGSAKTRLERPWLYEREMEFLVPYMQFNRKRKFDPDLDDQSASNSAAASWEPEWNSDRGSTGSVDYAPVTEDEMKFRPSVETEEQLPVTTHRSKPSRLTKDEHVDADTAVISILKDSIVKNNEDPAIGWFRSLLPMYNSLTSIEKLEFQSKVVLELRGILVAKEQRKSSA